MARYIELDEVRAKIEKIIADETESIKSFEHSKNVSEVQRSNARIGVLMHIRSLLNTLEVKDIDLDALGVLAEHLIACDAHLVTPKYTDKELDLLEEWAKNNKPQKGEKRKSIWHPMSEIRKIDYPCDVFLHGYGSDIWIADINEACEKSTAQEWAHIDDVLEATGIKTKEK